MKTKIAAFSAALLFSVCFINAESSDWFVRKAPLNEHLYSVAYGGVLYVAVGNNRTILTSRNGADWTLRMHNTNGHGWLSGVAYGNNTFVSVGNGYQRTWPLSSPSTWGPPGSAGFSLNSNAAPIVISHDGMHWKPLRRGSASLSAVAFGRGRFVAIGLAGLITSRDGYNWFSPTNFYNTNGVRLPITPADLVWRYLTPVPTQIAFGNGIFLVRSWRGAAMMSTNGLDWISFVSRPTYESTLDLLAFGASRFVSPRGALYAPPLVGQLVSSKDAVNWSLAATLPFNIVSLGPWHHNGLAAGGSDTEGRSWLQTSPDGLDWSAAPTQVPATPYSITYGQRGVIAVGANGLIVYSPLPRLLPH